ncbi:hypothetical protein Btru_025606 [Bulinus truncatus]|nr:hypothetical protein Btru_025606 [Bulinus truncatus]
MALVSSASHTWGFEEEDLSTSQAETEAEAHQQEPIESDTVTSVADIHYATNDSPAKHSIISEKIEVESSDSILETNILIHCIYRNNLQRLQECHQNEADHHRKELIASLNQRDHSGKSPLDMAACLGRVEIVQFLVGIGGDINSTNSKGYTCLHFAAAWGWKAVLKLLVEKGGNFQLRNIFDEKPREVAHRYNHTECVYFLDWSEAKVKLEDAVSNAHEIISEQVDKNATVKLTKEEKFIVINTCKEKQEWMDKNKDASIQDFEMHLTSFMNIVQPILEKIQEQATQKETPLGLKNLKEIRSTPAPNQ